MTHIHIISGGGRGSGRGGFHGGRGGRGRGLRRLGTPDEWGVPTDSSAAFPLAGAAALVAGAALFAYKKAKKSYGPSAEETKLEEVSKDLE